MVKRDPDSAPVPSTVVCINSDVIQPDHITWSTFNTVFMNGCCLGFIAYIYSVKVSVVEGMYVVVAPPAQRAPGSCTALCLCMCDTPWCPECTYVFVCIDCVSSI